ncbi:Crp/Fnr family transcriptional regulator [Maribellus maritimus]|uniref:Crp/Fnr family transcriptional regulator n=1 Tax=Maribellus maritimus TaxID=2870838 RepID=UPI001EEA2CCB|nr:Crp/Fnr family transcriptional regulator [Maribellus maritimus]MCG6191026.1 Crp/Fnr family transcriptional regulator [Maribellus maritimus]
MIENLKDHIANFINIKNIQLTSIGNYFEIKELPKKKLILEEGEICRDLFFVNKGCLQIFYMKKNGTEQTIDFALENWWTTDFNAFANKTPSKFSIRTIEPSEILILNKSAQNKLLEFIPELERYFHLVFQRAYAASQYRIKLLYELSREELYLHFRDNFPDFIQRVPQYLIASFLGFTPEYMSEIRRKYIS